MIPYAREIGAAVVLAAILGAGWAGWEWRDRSSDAEMATLVAQHATEMAGHERAAREASERARSSERARTEDLAAIAEQSEVRIREIQSEADTLAADLRAGNVRLRQHWQGAIATCGVSRDSAAAFAAEREAELRAEGAADLVRLAADADARVTALQDAYEAIRRPAPEDMQ